MKRSFVLLVAASFASSFVMMSFVDAPAFAFGRSRAASHCDLPQGEIADARIPKQDPCKAVDPNDVVQKYLCSLPVDSTVVRNFVQPTQDCKSIRVFSLVQRADGSLRGAPSDEECKGACYADMMAAEDLWSCCDYQVFRNEKNWLKAVLKAKDSAENTPFPASFQKGKSLVTYTPPIGFGGDIQRSYRLDKGKIYEIDTP